FVSSIAPDVALVSLLATAAHPSLHSSPTRRSSDLTSATSCESVATATDIAELARAASHTYSIIGRPAIFARTLRGRRWLARWAGITTWKLIARIPPADGPTVATVRPAGPCTRLKVQFPREPSTICHSQNRRT